MLKLRYNLQWLLLGPLLCQATGPKQIGKWITGNIEKLEQIRIAQQIVFEKIVAMHKGQQRKIKSAICNVPVECDQTCNQLPHPPDRSCIIILKHGASL